MKIIIAVLATGIASTLSTIGFAAQRGAPCGSSAGSPGGLGIDDKPPIVWSYPTCEVPVLASTLCQPGTNGWFSALVYNGHTEWRTKCCQPGDTAVESFDYTDDGDLIDWGLVCYEG